MNEGNPGGEAPPLNGPLNGRQDGQQDGLLGGLQDGALGIFSVSDAGIPWLVLAGLFLLGGLIVSTILRMLDLFSRKSLLDEADEADRLDLEDVLSRVDGLHDLLEVLDRGIRLGFIASFAFAFLAGGEHAEGIHADALRFLVFVAVAGGLSFLCLGLAPGVLARLRTEETVRALLPFLDRTLGVLAPLSRRYGAFVRSGARALGGDAERTRADVVQEEILKAVEEGERDGILMEGETSMIEAIIRFRDREVSEVMTPRTDMVCIGMEETIGGAVRAAINCGHSRIPVYRENKDNIAGILYVKDLLKTWENAADRSVLLRDVIRQAHYVPESKKVSELFHEFKSQRFHIAVVLDEFGGTSGLITIEDIIEEILGEIAEEFEEAEPPEVLPIGEGLVEVDARLPIRDFNARLDADLPEGSGYDTVGGFLFSALGKIPRVGESVEHGRVRLEVIKADERKVTRLRVRLASPADRKKASGGE